MKQQPAYVNYFFKGGYIEFGKTIKNAFIKCGEDIKKSAELLADAFFDLASLKSFFSAIVCAATLGGSGYFDFKEMLYALWALIKFTFALCKLIFVTIATTALTFLFSVLHTGILAMFFLITYLFFGIVWLSDAIYCGLKKIATSCPNCQEKYSLPTYVCTCGREHTALKPSKYGILTRKCLCGAKLKTTFFNGRQKLPGKWICPKCSYELGDSMHTDIPIPVVGGPSSGKTCFINMTIKQIEEVASGKYNLEFIYKPNVALGDDFEENKENMSQGLLPLKTNDLRLKYYQFYLTQKGKKVKNLVSICDVAGETYDNNDEIGRQVGFKNATGFILIVDPLSVQKFREENSENIDISKYGVSEKPMDEVLNILINTLENMNCLSSKSVIKTHVAVVFSKGDIPGIADIIGENAVQRYLEQNPTISRLEAQNIVSEKFLIENEEENFLNILKSKFKNIQFFTSSALGHIANGQKFTPQGVEEPVLWVLDQVSDSINLKDTFNKR